MKSWKTVVLIDYTVENSNKNWIGCWPAAKCEGNPYLIQDSNFRDTLIMLS